MAHQQLLKIDDLVIADHSYLNNLHQCYYFMEYTARAGFDHSEGNQLISNFKKPLKYRGTNAWQYKIRAMRKVAAMFDYSLPGLIDLDEVTLVPIPPSKTKLNPLHDARMFKTLEMFGEGKNDVREMLCMIDDMDAAHESDTRPSIAELEANMELDLDLCNDLKDTIILFDDVITTGAHFVACQNILKREFPDVAVLGVFVARRSIPPVTAWDFFDEE